MPQFTDQLGNTISFEKIPKRIISLVPSQSEFLWDLGLEREIIGITKFCVHPTIMFREKERVGGTKKLDIEKIKQLNPDLIVGNKEENNKDEIDQLKKEFRVWMSDVNTIPEALQMMRQLSIICGKEKMGEAIIESVNISLKEVKGIMNGTTTAYFMWNDPYMVAANKTFINSVLEFSGFINVFSGEERYPVKNLAEISEAAPAVCLLSNEPFPFKEEHRIEMQEKLPQSTILLADGELLSWYGSRMRFLSSYLNHLKLILHP